jgi:hypothetical protein
MLKIEWLKWKSYRPFWVLMSLYPAALFGVLLLLVRFYQFLVTKEAQASTLIGSLPFAFPGIWHTVTYVASFFHFIPAVLILLSVCNEFQFRTHRQNLLDGWTRWQFFVAKLSGAGLVSLICLFWVALAGLLVGLYQGGSFSLRGTEVLGQFLLQCALYNSLALFIGFWLRRGLVSLAVFLVYSNFLEKVVAGIASIQMDRIGYYAPLQVANQLIPFPVWKQAVKRLTADAPDLSTLLPVACLYVLFFVALSWTLLRKDDL